jgi:hypothetical protein
MTATRKPRPDLSERNRQRAKPFDDLFIPEPNSGCWLWLGGTDRYGYGRLRRGELAHRFSWAKAHGCPGSTWVLHRCDNPACVNPDHLFLGDVVANVADMMAKGRHKAPRGDEQPNAKLNAGQVVAIRKDPRSQKSVAAEYGVAPSLVNAIRNRKAWRHIP